MPAVTVPILRSSGENCDLDVVVQPGARRTGLVAVLGDRVKIAVSAPPVDGRANEAVVQLLADLAGVPPSRVGVVRGASDRRKTVRFMGVADSLVAAALERHGVAIPRAGSTA